MSKLKLFIAGILIFSVVACGGGNSSSDESSNNDGDGENPVSGDLDGLYSGMQTLLLSLGGVTEEADIDATVTVNGNAILIDPLTANGSIANGTFVATTNRTSTQGDLTCQFLLTYQGEVSSELLNGTISGTAICDQGSGNETLDVTGTVSATRN